MQTTNSNFDEIPATVSDQTIVTIVEKQLPGWKQACENRDADTVLLTQAAFGHSAKEVFLLAAAIKYAGMKQKTVTVIPQN